MALLNWLLDPSDHVTRLARTAQTSKQHQFLEVWNSSTLTFLGIPDGFQLNDSDPDPTTAEELLAVIESTAKNLSERDEHIPLRIELDGESVLPIFSQRRHAQRFVENYVRRVNRIVPFFLLTIQGADLRAAISEDETILLNAETRHEVRLLAADVGKTGP
ncbi:MAG: hypothetical protein ACRC8S_11015 [Fimbriiglobus sp.]